MKVSDKAYSNALLNLKECEQKKVILSSYPLKIYIEPTMDCNLCCEYCYAQSDRRVKPLDMKIFYALEKQLFEHLSEVNLFLRGEPTLYKDFSEMLDVCSKYPFIIKFFSNLSYSIDEALLKKIVEAGAWVNVSFDGLNSSMRKGENVEQIFKNIKTLKAIQKQINQDKFHLRIATVVGKNNVEFLCQLIELVKELDIQEIMLGCLDSRNELALTSDNAQRFDDAVKVADKLKVRISTPTHVGGQKLKKNSNWHEFSLPVDKYFEFYCEEVNPNVESKFCPYPWIQTVIQADGEVISCCQGKKHLGNFSPDIDFIKDIWNNKKYQELRSLNDHNFCNCNIMKYSIWGGNNAANFKCP
jgi:MoaA/NifB/PqqE/SkfB family radical SAM enzyme